MTSFVCTCDLATAVATVINILIKTKTILNFTNSTRIDVHLGAGPVSGTLVAPFSLIVNYSKS